MDFDSVPHTLVLEQGEPHDQIIARAKTHSADLNVMGATGQSRLPGVLRGSTTASNPAAPYLSTLLTIREQDVTEVE